MQILGSCNSAANKNMILKIWTNGVQLSYQVETTVGKEEIAQSNNVLKGLLPQDL